MVKIVFKIIKNQGRGTQRSTGCLLRLMALTFAGSRRLYHSLFLVEGKGPVPYTYLYKFLLMRKLLLLIFNL